MPAFSYTIVTGVEIAHGVCKKEKEKKDAEVSNRIEGPRQKPQRLHSYMVFDKDIKGVHFVPFH